MVWLKIPVPGLLCGARGLPALEIHLGGLRYDRFTPGNRVYLGQRGSSRLLHSVRNRAESFKEKGGKVTQITPLSWHRC